MKLSEWEEAKKWLVQPRPNKKDKDKILKDFYKESTDHWNKQNPNAKKKPMNLLKYIDTVNKLYGDKDIKIKSDAEYERLNPTKKAPVAPTIEHTKIGTIKNFDKPKKVIKKVVEVEKPKPKPKPTIQQQLEFEDYLNTLDPVWWEEDKLVSQPSIDESNATWWENMYYDYKKSGGELNFQQFKNMLLKEGDIGDLGAKKRLDGIRKILIA